MGSRRPGGHPRGVAEAPAAVVPGLAGPLPLPWRGRRTVNGTSELGEKAEPKECAKALKLTDKLTAGQAGDGLGSALRRCLMAPDHAVYLSQCARCRNPRGCWDIGPGK